MATKIRKSRFRAPIKRHGGKGNMAGAIVDVIDQPLFAPHSIYVEPFAGGLSVLLSKRRVPTEVIGDLDGDLIAMWRAIRDECDQLVPALAAKPYTRETWESATDGSVVSTIVRSRMSRGGLGNSFAWSDRQRGGQPGDVNAWQTMIGQLPAVSARMQGVTVEQRDGIDLFTKWDSPTSLAYLDPPYLHETRTARRCYQHEMTTDDHVRLLDAIASARGHVAISGYRSSLYDGHLRAWRRLDFERPNDSGQGDKKQRRIECLWVNW